MIGEHYPLWGPEPVELPPMSLDDLTIFLSDVIDDINGGHYQNATEVLDTIKDAIQ